MSILTLPLRSGFSTTTRLSKRPGRSRAGSSISGLLVAPSTMMPLPGSKPSISLKSWLRVCSRSSLPPKRVSLDLPMASISSMKMMQGALAFACLKRSLTLDAPTPTNISTKSEPVSEKKGTSASPATALASRVLPVPGGPTSRAPLGSFAPMERYFAGLCRKSTISTNDSFASSSPATSSKVTPVSFCMYILALDFPTPMMPPEPPILLDISIMKKKIAAKGRITLTNISRRRLDSCFCW